MRRPPHDAILPPAIVLAAFLMYAFTAAPGLLWGDSAKFQRMAWEGELRFDETGHPLWVVLAHPIARIPGLDPARACNLLSALLSALALWPAFRIMRRLGATPAASGLACLAMAVSHTFWFHAVVAEVYALNSLVALGSLDFVTRVAAGRPAGTARWLAMGVTCGLASGNHLMVLLWLPGIVWWIAVARRAGRASRPAIAMGGLGFAVGLLPFVVLRAEAAARSGPFVALAGRLLRQALLPESPGRDALQYLGYLFYQFPVPLMLAAAAAGGIRLRRERPADLTGLLILYAANVMFAFSYRVPDRFAFYLPSYLILSLAAARGLDLLRDAVLLRAGGRLRWVVGSAAVAACVVAPPVAYAVAPSLASEGILSRFPRPRALPGRDAVRFHLDPCKRGDTGASRFGRDALEPLPPRAVVIADYTLHEPLDYVQRVEGLRPDVEVYYVLPADQLERALDLRRQSRRVYIAARDPFYDVASLSSRFDIRPSGPIFELVPR